jgi:hypothetical protein
VNGTLETLDTTTPVPEGRPRSGYARIRQRHHRLIAEHEALKAEHENLQRHHEALKAGHQELQSAFDELLNIHNGLLADLKQSQRARSAASSLAGFPLMGERHG